MLKAFLAVVAGFVFTLAVFVSGLGVATWFLAAKPVQQPEAGVDVADLWTREPRTVKKPIVGLERLPARPLEPDARNALEPAEGGRQDLPGVTQAAAAADSSDTAGAVELAADSGEALADEPLDTTPLDDTITGALQPAEEEPREPALPARVSEAHLEWCASRYRSYNPSTNTYRPYSGGTRPCVSPYLENAIGAEAATDAEAAPAFEPDAAQYSEEGPAHAMDAYVDTAGDPAPELGYASAGEDGFRVVSDDHIAYCFSRYRSYRPEDNTYQPYGGGPRRQCE